MKLLKEMLDFLDRKDETIDDLNKQIKEIRKLLEDKQKYIPQP